MKPTLFFVAFLLSAMSSFAAQPGVWETKSPMLWPRSDFTATTVGDAIYLFGGCSADQVCPESLSFCYCPAITNTAEVYYPLSDSWMELATMPHNRTRHAASALGSKIYVFGGRDVNDNIINEVDVFDTLTMTWSTLPSLWMNASSDLAGFTIGNNLYAMAGYALDYTPLNTLWLFSSVSSQFQLVSTSTPAIARGDVCGLAADGLAFIFGGFSNNFCSPLSALQIYDPTSNTWRNGTGLPVGRGDMGCTVVNQRFHIVGGEEKDDPYNCSKFSIPIFDFDVYVEKEDRWVHETELPATRFRFAAASHAQIVYIFGGQENRIGQIGSNQYVYPVTNSVFSIFDDGSAVKSQATFTSSLSPFSFFSSLFALFLLFQISF